MEKNRKFILLEECEVNTATCGLSEYFKKRSILLKANKIDDESDLDNGRDYYPRKKFAKLIGVSDEVLKKKLNGSKPITRDFIFALGAAYGLGSDATNEVMHDICGMPGIDRTLTREDEICEFLDRNIDKMVSLEQLNEYLHDKGYDEKDEIIMPHRNKDDGSLVSKIPQKFTALEPPKIKISLEEEMYESLSTKYMPKTRCTAAVLLKSRDNSMYMLSVVIENKYTSYVIYTETEPIPQTFSNISETGDFRPYFVNLYSLAKRKKAEVDRRINDTRNYHTRFSANIKFDSIHIFHEEYNYDAPERNEYYLMEYIGGKTSLYISHKSLFMKEYLSPEEYDFYYPGDYREPFEKYSSLADIEKKLEIYKDKPRYSRLRFLRLNTFKRLSQVITDELKQLQDRTVFINNPSYMDYPPDILDYYNLKERFNYSEVYDEGSDTLNIKYSDTIKYTLSNGDAVHIAFDDLIDAFELGFSNIEQIARVKRKYGSIRAIITPKICGTI